jgi:hypothetical protein
MHRCAHCQVQVFLYRENLVIEVEMRVLKLETRTRITENVIPSMHSFQMQILLHIFVFMLN